MFRKYRKIISLFNIFLLLVFLCTAGLGCRVTSPEAAKKMQPLTLNFWSVWDDEDAYADIIKDYQVAHPNITINYRKFTYEEYESQLLNALAEDRGPDIFSLPQSWLLRYQNKLLPLPKEVTMAYQTIQQGITKEKVITLKKTPTPTTREIKDNFADTVLDDASIDGQVYGLPLSLETLIMLYNKDILNQAGVAKVPAAWKDFQDAVAKISKVDEQNNVILSGTALGTGGNVEHAFDILSALLMQNQAVMTDVNGRPVFFQATSINNKTETPGATALQFYADFASPQKAVYSWNASSTDSLDAFISGKVGFIFDYNFNLPVIRARAPKLNFGLAPLPQIAGNPTVNYANYWLQTVSKKTKYQDEAWDFIIYMATKQEEAQKYLDVTKRPTALKGLIDKQLQDEDLYPAASQVLTAKTWYKGYDFAAANQAITDMLDKYVTLDPVENERQIRDLLSITLQKISQTLVPPST